MVMIPKAPRVGDMRSNEPVPEGTYHLRCDKAELKETKKKQSMAAVQLTVFGPEEAEAYHGQKIFENFMLEGEGTFRVRQFLEASGEDEDFVLEDTDQLQEREVAGVVIIEPQREDPETGEIYEARNSVKRFLKLR